MADEMEDVKGFLQQAGAQGLRRGVEQDGLPHARHRPQRVLDAAELALRVESGNARWGRDGDQHADGRLQPGGKGAGYVQEPDDGALAAEIEKESLILAIEAFPGEGGQAAHLGPVRIETQDDPEPPVRVSLDPSETALEEIADLAGEEGLKQLPADLLGRERLARGLRTYTKIPRVPRGLRSSGRIRRKRQAELAAPFAGGGGDHDGIGAVARRLDEQGEVVVEQIHLPESMRFRKGRHPGSGVC